MAPDLHSFPRILLNDNCGKTAHMGTMDRAFTVCEVELNCMLRSIFSRFRAYIEAGGQPFKISS
jgi:hypothetical protein